MAWNNEITKRLTQLWKDGLTGSQIARALRIEYRVEFSRSAILGRAWRLDLPKKQPGTKKYSPRPKQFIHPGNIRRKKKSRKSDPGLKPTVESPMAPEPLNLTLEELKLDSCRYPYGDENYRFCGHPVGDTGSSYCEFHHNECLVSLEASRAARKAWKEDGARRFAQMIRGREHYRKSCLAKT